MSVYDKILKQYQQMFKCNEFEQRELSELMEMTRQIAQVNAGSNQLNHEIAQQIEEQVTKTYDKKVIIRDFISTILVIYNIISSQIKQSQEGFTKVKTEEDKKVILSNLQQLTTFHEHISNIFCLSIKQQSKIRKILKPNKENQYKASQTLKAALILIIASLMAELVLMFYRFSFLNSLAYVLSLSIFFLNFFDRSYIRTCILVLLLSIILDLNWCLLFSNLYLGSSLISSFSVLLGNLTLKKINCIKFAKHATIVLMIFKLLILLIFFRYRNVPNNTKRSVEIFRLEIKLQNKAHSPIKKLGIAVSAKGQNIQEY